MSHPRTLARRVPAVHYQPPPAVETLRRAFGWTLNTARAKLNPAHPASPVKHTIDLFRTLVLGGHQDRAEALRVLIEAACIPGIAEPLDVLEEIEQRADGLEDEAQVAFVLVRQDAELARVAWDTRRRKLIASIAAQLRVLKAGDMHFRETV